MQIVAIVLLVLLGLFVFIRSKQQHKLFLNKFVIIFTVIAVGILVIGGKMGSNDPQQVAVPYYQQIAPSSQDAPYVLQTSSRAYYVVSYNEIGDIVELTDYYYFNEKEWERAETSLPLDRRYYGNIQITKRNIGG